MPPFNINVTTVKPANMGHGYTQQVDIGGNGAWTGSTYGGLTYTGSFANTGLPNVSFVFSANLANGDPLDTGDAISHEAGHGFGLYHQAEWSGNTLVADYWSGPGNGLQPIMGYAYGATRALWWDGTNDQSPTTIQDDMAVIANATNGFGYRPEPSNISAGSAAPVTVSGTQISASGLIIHTTDQDYFSFTTGAGSVTLTVTPQAAGVNNLVPTIELVGSNGTTVLAANTTASYSASITANVAAGTYYVVVGSEGGYDDVGQYTVSGTIGSGSGGSAPASPTGLTAAAGNGQVTLGWTAVSGASSYNVYRSSTSGGEGGTPYQAGLTSASFTDTGASNGTTWYYEVTAVNTNGQSGMSSQASAAPQAGGSFSASGMTLNGRPR